MEFKHDPERFILFRALLTNGAVARWVAWFSLGIATVLLLRAEAVLADLPVGIKVSSDLVYREIGGRRLRLDVYEPESPTPATGRAAILAIHGGGWRGGSKLDFGRSLIPLVKQGFVVVAIDYRLSRPGEPSWPGNLEDVREALAWVHRSADRLKINPRRIAVMGASAGAQLALLLGETYPKRPGNPPIRALIDFYGPTDLKALTQAQPRTVHSVELLLGGSADSSAESYEAASPLKHVKPSHPPTLIVHGKDDLLVPDEQSISYARALQREGVFHKLIALPKTRHGFGLQVGQVNLVPEIARFFDEACASTGDLD